MAPFLDSRWYTSTNVAALYAAAGGAPATTPAQSLVDTWASGGAGSDGFAMVFEDAGGTDAPSIYIKDSGTPANNTDINLTDDFSAFNSFLTYTSPSPKIVRQSDGDLKYCAHNYVLQSEDFGTTWSATNVTVATNTGDTTDPNGGSTADKITLNTATAAHHLQQTVTQSLVNGNQYYASVYLKAGTLQYVNIRLGNNTQFGSNSWATFDLSGGTVTEEGSDVTAAISSVGNSWYRCSIVLPAVITTTNWIFYIAASNSATPGTSLPSFTGASETFYVWGAQNSLHPADTTYLPTTTAARYALPIQHDSSNNAEGLLVEPASTNLLIRSNDFSNATWTKTRASVAMNATGPDGVSNSAATVTDDSSTGANSVRINSGSITVATATTYTFSAYLKADQLSWAYLRQQSFTTPANGNVWFNLSTGSVGTENTGMTGAITDVGGGWYRCSITFTTDASDTEGSLLIGVADADNDEAVDLDGTSSILVYGAQFETGTVPTSPIITTGATATRAKDVLTADMTATPVSDTAGTIYFKHQYKSAALNDRLFDINDGTSNNRCYVLTNPGGTTANFDVVVGGSQQSIALFSGANGDGTDDKTVASWAANDFAVVVNNGTVQTDTSGSVPSGLTTLNIACDHDDDPVSHILIYEILYLPEAMSDGDMGSITT